MTQFKNILVAIDISDEAKQVMSTAQFLAESFQANLSLIHVVEPIILENSYDMINSLPQDIEMSLVKRAEEYIDNIKNEFSLNIDSCVKTGSIKNEITEQIKAHNIDLVVVGSHGRHGFGLLLGSTANALIHGLLCDIHVVRIKD